MISIFKNTVLTFAVLLTVSFFKVGKALAQPGVAVSIQTFYDELEPYGQWIDDPELGYVWLPDAGPDFKPYATDGHWVATEYGNTWVSDYNWGWAPFHYGRWRFAEDYGWEWIPGTEWAPAWVNWRTGDDYYGWAPLGPGIDIDISFGSNYYEADNYWVFAPRRSIYARNINQYYVPYGRNYSIIRNTTIINNVYSNNNRRYISGPRFDDVRRYTNSPVHIYNINTVKRPGGAKIRNNTLSIYRPEIAGNRNDNNRPRPNRVYNSGNVNLNGINSGQNPTFNNPRQPINTGNGGVSNNTYENRNDGYGRSRSNTTGLSNGNQFPQRNPNLNNNTNGVQGANGNNSSDPVNRPTRGSFPNQPAQNQNGQTGNINRPASGFDYNRPRTPNNQIQAPNQAQQQSEQNQRNQQQMQQRNQQQQPQQRSQQQERPQQQERQQRPIRQEVPGRSNNRS